MACKLGTDCRGPLWPCRSCGAEFCLDHSHVTAKGANVECIDCETQRLDADDATAARPLPAAERVLASFDKEK